MTKFEEQKFNIGELKGISAKNIEEHLKLYAGYVKNVNGVIEKIAELSLDTEKNMYVLGEMSRRFSFEYNGMRNHEVYFNSLSGGAKNLNEGSDLAKSLTENFGTLESFLTNLKTLALTRGIGWAVLWYDKKNNHLLSSSVDEQHLGQLNGCDMILAIDMWEHAFVYDYPTSQKKDYVNAFFENLNWEVIENNFKKALA
ncbi:MAG: superoxide dismutase [Candidatus Nomurabacteria bacterium]|nr:superoxide dismutase [Candidatus Nomurabacteria bacterium]